ELGAGVQQSLAVRILAHHAGRPILWDAVLAISQTLPRRAVVFRLVDVRLEIAEQVTIDRVVRAAFAVRRRLDVLHASAVGQILRRDVLPTLAVVARDEERTVVRAGPDHARLELRLADRVERAIELLTGHIACDGFAAAALTARGFGGEIGRDLLPVDAA